MAQAPHTPVLLERCVELLGHGVAAAEAEGTAPVIVDATLGAGGHSAGILEAFPTVRLIGIDRDPNALEIAGERLAGYGERFQSFHATDDEMAAVLDRAGCESVSGVLFDLGVSSMHLDEDVRGFSYARSAPLDMRMDPGDALTAAEVLNTYSEAELTRILRDYGEERYARKIARVIVADREQTPWETSDQLVAMLQRVIPQPAGQRQRSHPAKRTFQALRIEVNAELDILRSALDQALTAVHTGGVVAVESYQSLEDSIVKRAFRAGLESQAPADLPIVPPELQPWLAPLTRGAEKAPAAEIERNPRAASVRLRAVQKTRQPCSRTHEHDHKPTAASQMKGDRSA
ncbi:16S rRNA (cytosine(1402)-N(4))-methyltransferase RsmH [Brevibacterium otitidis]|uniref:Ribosomal RNA small subunit methyltransferase H n=1 Tax=Brevibacterium otitidis TaxID=53364 RepID=A0ABV5X6Q6_9MICO|nr:16S rRNA (cytosine(1402)-N(4))-methyltransferase RsmH [Brevibacterium otitidis]